MWWGARRRRRRQRRWGAAESINAISYVSGTVARSRTKLISAGRQEEKSEQGKRKHNHTPTAVPVSSNWCGTALHTWAGAETEEEEMEGEGSEGAGSEGAAAAKGKPQ